MGAGFSRGGVPFASLTRNPEFCRSLLAPEGKAHLAKSELFLHPINTNWNKPRPGFDNKMEATIETEKA
jgi:hypothetical protein